MRLNWKYFLERTLTTVVILFVVILIISVFLGITYEREKNVHTRNYVYGRAEDNYKNLSEMDVDKREAWVEHKAEEYRVGDNSESGQSIRNKEVYPKSVWHESIRKASQLLRLDFGKSEFLGPKDDTGDNSVVHIIISYLPRTVLLYVTALFIYIPLSVFLGAKAATGEGDLLKKFISFSNILGSSVPVWWAAWIGLFIFAYYFGWISYSAMPFPRSEGLEYLIDVFKKMIFPLSVIVLIKSNPNAWITRNLVENELEKDYVKADRAKGLPENIIVKNHALKSSAPPIISRSMNVFLNSIPEMVILETLVGWPGIGLLFFNAINYQLPNSENVARDIPVVLGLVFFITLLTVILQLIADILYGLSDPRIRYKGE